MEVMIILVPLAIALGAAGLAGFLWSLKNGQYDDLDGAAWRAILDDEPPALSDGEQEQRAVAIPAQASTSVQSMRLCREPNLDSNRSAIIAFIGPRIGCSSCGGN